MAEKVSTLIIETNLDCAKCYRKIQQVLCKLQEQEKIRGGIDFDTKKNTVTVSGPFDPVKLSGKLRCKACEAIKGITIVEEKKPEPKEEDKKPAEEKKKPADDCCKCCKKQRRTCMAPAPAPSTTVNLHFTQICNMCYPWPCSDPSHWGGVHQYPQPQHYPYPAWPAPTIPKRQPCGGPPYCGCGSCGGGYNGWPPAMPTPLQTMQPQPMGCGGPSSCRGCKGCWIVQEEYPPNSCTVM